MEKTKRNLLSGEQGFTLVEIIAVLVILGILSAVAVPKFIDLQNDAREKAAQGAIAEVKSRLSLAYGKLLLSSGTAPTSVANICSGLNDSTVLPTDCSSAAAVPGIGDYTVTVVANNTSSALITVTAVQGTALTSNITGTWSKP